MRQHLGISDTKKELLKRSDLAIFSKFGFNLILSKDDIKKFQLTDTEINTVRSQAHKNRLNVDTAKGFEDNFIKSEVENIMMEKIKKFIENPKNEGVFIDINSFKDIEKDGMEENLLIKTLEDEELYPEIQNDNSIINKILHVLRKENDVTESIAVTASKAEIEETSLVDEVLSFFGVTKEETGLSTDSAARNVNIKNIMDNKEDGTQVVSKGIEKQPTIKSKVKHNPAAKTTEQDSSKLDTLR